MPVSPRTALGSTQLNRDYWLDVNIGSESSPNWIGVFGMMEFTPNITPTTQDASDFDAGGYGDEEITAIKWDVQAKLRRGVQPGAPTQYDPGQEVLRLASTQLGNGNRVHIRFYEMGTAGPRVEAYEGYANVQWKPDGGSQDAIRTVSVTLGGKGKRVDIAHPDTGTPPAPVVSGLAPATSVAAGGVLVIASGTNFTSATAVEVTGTVVPAADWEMISDTRIALKTPAKTAGTYNVRVTNPGGQSAIAAGNQIVYS